MSNDLTLHNLNKYVEETVNLLNSKFVQDETALPPIGGWHNFFEERIGTTGSAVPLLFLIHLKIDFHYREIVNKLLTSQSADGSWAILSVEDISTVEGTTWCLRALAFAGDNNAREAVYKAEEWLLSQQNQEGGWGSTIESSPRIFLTVASIETLAALTAPSQKAILKAVNWLSKIQRSDGSWGEESGQDGTVFHTAIVAKSLLELGLSVSDSRIVDAISFLKKNWKPNSRNFLKEIYYINYSGKQIRNNVDHDVDSAVIQLLLKLRTPWAIEMILKAAKSMVDLYIKEGKLSPPDMKPSIWNIIPRATVFFDLLNYFPISEKGRVLNFREVMFYSSSETNLNKKDIAFLLLRRIIVPQFPITSFLLLFVISITTYQIYGYFNGFIEPKDIIMSFGVELAGLFIGLIIEKKLGARNG